jgi:hypothetical protein
VSGSGKTWTALALAHRLSDNVGVIDTERGRARLYSGINGWRFKHANPQSFSPQSLTEGLAVAAGQGIGCLIVDSWSHYWMGVDGMLDQVDRRGKASGNNFGGWKEMRPDERRMVDALSSYPGHIIVTLRVKTEYVTDVDQNGKKVMRKIGLRPEQRDNIEYEFDLVGDLDFDNTLTVSKTRIPSLAQAVIPKPGPDLAEKILDFLEQGDDLPDVNEYRSRALALVTVDALKALFDEATNAGMAGAPCLGVGDQPTVLGDFIRALATALKREHDAGLRKPAEEKAAA